MSSNHYKCLPNDKTNEDVFFKKLEVIGFVCVSVIGTLMHFAYEFFHFNPVVGIFAPVNESTFEHLKLLLYPALVYTVIEYYILKSRGFTKLDSFICARTTGIISGLISIVVLFYTYLGVLGHNVDFVNIAIYFIAVLITFFLSYIITKNRKQDNHCQLCLLILAAIVILFLLFTIYPADIGLFWEP